MIAKRDDYSSSLDVIIVIRPNFKETEFHENELELNALLDHTKEIKH